MIANRNVASSERKKVTLGKEFMKRQEPKKIVVVDLKTTLFIRSGKLIPTVRVCGQVAFDQRFIGTLFGRNRGRRSEYSQRSESRKGSHTLVLERRES